jgi:hypothetical protein
VHSSSQDRVTDGEIRWPELLPYSGVDDVWVQPVGHAGRIQPRVEQA